MWPRPAVLLLVVTLGQVDLDCARPGEARHYVARLRLAEIEGAEDIHRAAMWEAFGRCPGGAAGEACRRSERGRFDARWEHERAAIEAKYRRILSDFEQRCRGTLSRGGPLRTSRAAS
jgi:hypothetical protein